MSRVNYTIEQIKKLGLIQVNGGAYEPISKHVDSKPKKIGNLLERSQLQSVPNNAMIGNAKVKNATKVEADGLKFDSKLEYFMYGLLRGAGIEFELQVVYELQPKFKFNGETIRSIKAVIDFYLPEQNIYIDTKGWQTYDGTIKYKLFKYSLIANGNASATIEMPRTKKECQELLNRLLFDSGNT